MQKVCPWFLALRIEQKSLPSPLGSHLGKVFSNTSFLHQGFTLGGIEIPFFCPRTSVFFELSHDFLLAWLFSWVVFVLVWVLGVLPRELK